MTSKRGFSLIELISVLAIVLVLAGGLATFMIRIMSLKKQVMVDERAMDVLRTSLLLIERDLRELNPQAYRSFEGLENEFRYYREESSTMIRLYVGTYDGRENTLIKEETLVNVTSSSAQTVVETSPLAFYVEGFSMRYFNGTVWLDAWKIDDSESALEKLVYPELLEISIMKSLQNANRADLHKQIQYSMAVSL